MAGHFRKNRCVGQKTQTQAAKFWRRYDSHQSQFSGLDENFSWQRLFLFPLLAMRIDVGAAELSHPLEELPFAVIQKVGKARQGLIWRKSHKVSSKQEFGHFHSTTSPCDLLIGLAFAGQSVQR